MSVMPHFRDLLGSNILPIEPCHSAIAVRIRIVTMDAVIVAAHCSRIRRERSGLVTGFELITIFRLNHGVGLVVTAERGELLWAHDFLHTGERCKAHDSLLSELTVCTIGQIKISHTVAAVQIDAIAAEMFIFVGHKPHIGKQHVAVDCPCNVLLTVVTSGDECNVLVAARITVVHQAAKKCIIAAQITVNLLTVDAVAVLCIVKTVNVKQRNVKIPADNIVFKAAHHQIIQIRLCTEKPRLCKAFRFQHSAHGKAGRTVTADDIDLTHEILRIPDARFCGDISGIEYVIFAPLLTGHDMDKTRLPLSRA